MYNWIQSSFEKLKEKESFLFTAVFIIIVSIRVWLITGIPKLLVNGPHDDLYFAKAAHYIIHGQWMGPYSQMTLFKGPFYAIFMIISFFTGLPLFLSETIFYIGACIVLFFAFVPLIENRWWRLLLFLIILYAPVSLATSMNMRVYRDFVYISLTLYIVAFSIGLFLRLNKGIPSLFPWSIGLGVSMGAFMITREEGVWIYPVLFLSLSSCIIVIWFGKTGKKIKRSFLILLPILLWQIPVFAVSYLNYSHYDFWGITENLDPDFNRVLSTLGRIKTSGDWYPTIQTPEEARMKAYTVSPLLNSLKDKIEGNLPAWNYWDDQAMLYKPDWYLSQYGNGGSEISNGHFLWLLRDAVYYTGQYANGKYPHDFYKQMADQLETACNNGKLDCSPPKRIPLVGSIDRRHYPIILRMFYEGILHLLVQDYIGKVSLDINTWPVRAENNDGYKYFEEFVYNSMVGPEIYPGQSPQFLVDGNTDLRLKMLYYKEKIMNYIANIYKGFTLSVFVASFFVWVYSLLLLIAKKQREHQNQVVYLIISLFLIGLFFSRFMTLTIVDATTTVAGMSYSGSNYLFIYLFSFLMMYRVFSRLTIILREARPVS